jgi:hypothetical protein
MSFTRRPMTSGDAADWASLWTAIEEADGSEAYLSEQDLRQEFGDLNRDFARGSIAIYDGRAMVGYGVLTCRRSSCAKSATPGFSPRRAAAVPPVPGCPAARRARPARRYAGRRRSGTIGGLTPNASPAGNGARNG